MDKIKEKLHIGHKDEAEPHADNHQAPPSDDLHRSGPPPAYEQPGYPPPGQGQGQGQGQYVPPPRPNAHGMQQVGQNAGMMTSVVGGMGGGGGAGAGGMWQDMAVGGFIGQQIGQKQNRAYWREQQQRYYAGMPAAGIADPRVAEPMSDRERRRAGRRKGRWDRRAARRGIEIPPQPVPGANVPTGSPMAAVGAMAGHHGHHGHGHGQSHGHSHGHGHHYEPSGNNTSGSDSDELSD